MASQWPLLTRFDKKAARESSGRAEGDEEAAAPKSFVSPPVVYTCEKSCCSGGLSVETVYEARRQFSKLRSLLALSLHVSEASGLGL